MRFWDSSALVPRLVEQSTSAQANAWAAEDPDMVVWTCTPVEITSALSRLQRERRLTAVEVAAREAAVDALSVAANIIVDVEAVKARARRALRIHDLRAADALQLGAALEWAQGRPDSGHVFHTFDARLAAAARLEGFRVLGAP